MFSIKATARDVAFVILGVSIGVYAAPGSAQQAEIPAFVDIVGGSTANGQMYWLDFTQSDAVEINTKTDQSANNGLNSFVFFKNTCGATAAQDIIAADTNSNALLLYPATAGLRSGMPICGAMGQPPCPRRPTGLSSSKNQEIAVVSSGQGNSKAGVWVIKQQDDAAACSDNRAQFSISGGAGLTFTSGNRTISASRLADTEFVHVDGGGLLTGDLLVLIESPPMIARVKLADITSSSTQATPLLEGNFFGKDTPTSIAFVPGTATPDRSEIMLVTQASGRVRQLTFGMRIDGSFLASAHDIVNAAGLFQNPRGIAAGTMGDETFAIIADLSQGQYFKTTLVNGGGTLSIDTDESGALRVTRLKNPIQSPMGIAVNRDEDISSAAQCFQPFTRPDGTTGCTVGGGFSELHFGQFRDGVPPNASVDVGLRFIKDEDSDRDGNGLLEFELEGLTFRVPPTCRGFPTDGVSEELEALYNFGGAPHLVLLEAELRNFLVPALEHIQITERTAETLNQGSCDETGARIYYHPSKNFLGVPLPSEEDGIAIVRDLFDTTFSCQNPSRSIVETFSPVMLCRDPVHLERSASGDLQLYRVEYVNPQIRLAINAIKDAVEEIEDGVLSAALQSLVVSLTNPNNANPNDPEVAREYFLETSQKADIGALIVFGVKKASIFDGADNPLAGDLYARLLRSFLWLAFYSKETGALEPYAPPAEFCESIYPDPGNPGGLFPELPDVVCAPPLP